MHAYYIISWFPYKCCDHQRAHLPDQFQPPKSFCFPKRKFGSKGEERRFRAEWCHLFEWLHYDVGLDVAFCHLRMKCELEKKFLTSTKRELAFISRGFTYWKEGMCAFKKHASSDYHRKLCKHWLFYLSTPRMLVSCRMRSMLHRKRGIGKCLCWC